MNMKKSSCKPRCRWCNPANPLYVAYHDEEWGRVEHDDRRLFEMLLLECFQAGLSWECILNKRAAFRAAFDDFDYERIACYDVAKCAALLTDPGIVRHRLKIQAAVTNARVFLQLRAEYGSFDRYLQQFTHGAVYRDWTQTHSPLSDALSADLRKRGMRYVGTTTLHAFLQAIGVVQAHEPGCWLYKEE